MTDYYIEAVSTWQQSDKNLKHFAECCANVDGNRTLALAQDCKCSVDTIENYRRAYRLYYFLEVEIESEPVRKLWQSAHISLWVRAAKLQKSLNLSNAKTMEYLQIASEEGMSRETFAAHVDTKENHTPQWIRRIRHAARILFPAKNDWVEEIPLERRERYRKATDWYISELEAIAEAE